MEGCLLIPEFWRSKRVLVTGHTGFKGSWLVLWLESVGADVTGFSLPPPTTPSLFEQANVGDVVRSHHGDVGEPEEVATLFTQAQPDVVFHLAAQSLVRASYRDPVETYRTNVLGTCNVLDALRKSEAGVAVIVTSDKCYVNKETGKPYKETDELGGRDPYSNSKACAELVTQSFRASFFENNTRIATARAGNVVGGGDWSEDRLMPDLARSAQSGRTAKIRNPHAIRPWQHILDCLDGYLTLAEKMWSGEAQPGPWNFGPLSRDARPVSWFCEEVVQRWPSASWMHDDSAHHPHEAGVLHLDSTKATTQLGWQPRLSLDATLEWTVDWYLSVTEGRDAAEMTLGQIDSHSSSTAG